MDTLYLKTISNDCLTVFLWIVIAQFPITINCTKSKRNYSKSELTNYLTRQFMSNSLLH